MADDFCHGAVFLECQNIFNLERRKNMKHKLFCLLVLAALILSACGGAPASGTDNASTEEASLPSVVHVGWAGSPES